MQQRKSAYERTARDLKLTRRITKVKKWVNSGPTPCDTMDPGPTEKLKNEIDYFD